MKLVPMSPESPRAVSVPSYPRMLQGVTLDRLLREQKDSPDVSASLT